MKTKLDIDAILLRIKSFESVSSDKEVAEILDISQANLSNQKKRGTLTSHIVNWAINKQIDLNWLLTGQETLAIKHGSDIKKHGVASERNTDLNSEYGELLDKTKEILKSGTESSNSLAASINSFHNAMKNERRIDLLERKMDLLVAENGRLKRKELIEKRKGERRKNNVPVENERRSGKDRRKSVF